MNQGWDGVLDAPRWWRVGYPVGDDDNGIVVVGSGCDWAQEVGRQVCIRVHVRSLTFGITAIYVCEGMGVPARARW